MKGSGGEVVAALAELADEVWGERIPPRELAAYREANLRRPGRVAVPRRSACHVLSRNTPQAGLQSLWRALLAGVEAHYVKFPSTGLPEVEAWIGRLPEWTQRGIRLGLELPETEWCRHDVIAVYGNDATISTFRARVMPTQRLLEFGHRWSIGIVEGEWAPSILEGMIEDITRFDQLGCLSLQSIFVERNGFELAQSLAGRMEERSVGGGREVDADSAALIFQERHSAQLRAALGESIHVWQSGESPAWTVIWDATGEKRRLPQHRFVEVRPLPDDLQDWLGEGSNHLGAVALNHAGVERWLALRPSRFCRFGRMQWPPYHWHQENRPPLDGWVDWVDLEVAGGRPPA